MAPNLLSGNGTLVLEEPLIRTPYELLRRSHRAAQRQVERDFIGVQTVLNGLIKSFGGEVTDTTRNASIGKLDTAVERIRGLKRKLDDLQPAENAPSPLRARLTYLEHMSKPPSDAPKGGVSSGSEEEGDNTLDRYIIDYLLRTGRMKSAKALAASKGVEELVDIKLFAELVKIETALMEKHSVVEALAWCGENRGTLKKTKNDLEFTLRMQDFIELCRKRDVTGAIAYSRKNLSPWAGTHMAELQQGMTLLAFGETTGVGLYKALYDQVRWAAVRDKFRETFLSLYALPGQPLLSLALSAGLSTLRLPSCAKYETAPSSSPRSPTIPLLPAAPPLHSFADGSIFDSLVSFPGSSPIELPGPTTLAPDVAHLQTDPAEHVGNVDCPTCGEDMKVLANEVPMSHHVISTIVCRISGEVMDSSNPPMAFPNGYVYSTNALRDMAKSNFDVVVCPRTGQSCQFSRLKKVFIS